MRLPQQAAVAPLLRKGEGSRSGLAGGSGEVGAVRGGRRQLEATWCVSSGHYGVLGVENFGV